jgi:F-type H+-transporting ATPase subunit gamma
VSRRAELEQRMGRLAEISDIMTAMKTMALIETRKFSRFMGHQQRLVASIEAAAADFLAFHPEFRGSGQAVADGDRHVLILIGSERGFCGDFNETVAAALAAFPKPEPRLVVVGRRLAGKLEDHPRLIEWLDGPTVAEEVRLVLDGLMDRLHRLQTEPPSWTRLSVLAHDPDGGIATHAVLPLAPPEAPKWVYPPRLNLDPAEFFAGLTEHFLIAKLPGLFYGSLMAENRRRLEHMERALGRMQTKIEDLGRRRNALRQEEITEEIEVILLSAESLLGGLEA